MIACNLIGSELNKAVADALGAVFKPGHRIEFPGGVPFGWMIGVFSPSTEWEHGGPLIEVYQMQIEFFGGEWIAKIDRYYAEQRGPSPLIAACRAIVAVNRAGSDA